MNEVARFEEKYIPEPYSGCWLWLAGENGQGYGQFYFNGRGMRANRASWIIHRGEIPAGLYVCHSCDTKSCVNPNHLFLGTAKDNTGDAIKKGLFGTLPGERNHESKLTLDQVKNILHEDGTCRAVAKKYGVGKTTINLIRNKKAWKHDLT